MIESVSKFIGDQLNNVMHYISTDVFPMIAHLVSDIVSSIFGVIASVGLIGILIYGIYVIIDDQ